MTKTLALLETLVDIVAIVGLVVLASLHVVDGSTVLPLITLVAGGSIGARVAARSRDGLPPSGDSPVNHSSVLALALAPLVQFATHARVAIVAALVVVALVVSGCGGSSSSLPATLWRLTRGACSVIVALPEGTDPAPETQAALGVKAVSLGPVVLVDVVDGGTP